MALPNRDVTITRTFDAPRALVWKAWTDPTLVSQWFGPEMFDIPFAELDLRPGGKYNIHMRGPDGTIYPDQGTYLEITPPERIVFTSCAFEDGQGGYLLETHNTLTLEEQAGRTLMTLQITVTKRAPEVEDALSGMEMGWSQSFGKLTERLAQTIVLVDEDRLEITVSRLFDAPRELVYKITTQPELLAQWWGPRQYETLIEELDLRVGGKWRFINRGADGDEHAFYGEYKEIRAPSRLVYTFEYAGTPGHPLVETITLEEYDGKTRVTAVDKFQSLEDLRGMAEAGMEQGVRESYERADELLARMQQQVK